VQRTLRSSGTMALESSGGGESRPTTNRTKAEVRVMCQRAPRPARAFARPQDEVLADTHEKSLSRVPLRTKGLPRHQRAGEGCLLKSQPSMAQRGGASKRLFPYDRRDSFTSGRYVVASVGALPG